MTRQQGPCQKHYREVEKPLQRLYCDYSFPPTLNPPLLPN